MFLQAFTQSAQLDSQDIGVQPQSLSNFDRRVPFDAQSHQLFFNWIELSCFPLELLHPHRQLIAQVGFSLRAGLR